ncbi:hypothetical protein VA7868_03234 [Vibrio aerogenes CECT 7868]|uniref:Uncharacterized protein n=2 Tax=Vibrio aerogenes TaxID=92172 RepID=A0A1M5ZU91_9VIBR|nr:hypothetical protein VA7868_03234 [Vibrio aerogenes CECT 7868]
MGLICQCLPPLAFLFEQHPQAMIYTNLENKLIIWMCLVEQTYKGMNALVEAPMDGLSGLRNQIYPDQKMT